MGVASLIGSVSSVNNYCTARKFLIPLLEWLDEQGVTRNVEGMRTLK